MLPLFYRSLFWVKLLLIILISFTCFLYYQIDIYDFPEPEAFSGDILYNPYHYTQGSWLKANFHAHAIAWNGLTNGHQSGQEVLRTYRKLQYDIPCLTDYFSINSDQNQQSTTFIPGYEHGINIHKSHRLAIGSDEVLYFDLPLYQNLSIRQSLIHKLAPGTPVIAIAHPSMRNSHSETALSYLSGYQCIEVVNHFRTATPYWDAALSAGKPVWILANDDCHDVSDPEKIGRAWTMVLTESPQRDSVLQALRLGRTYGVQRIHAVVSQRALYDQVWKQGQNILRKLTVDGQKISIRLNQPVRFIRFVGQHGTVLKEIANASEATFQMEAIHPYVRIEAEDNLNRYFFNPVIRQESQKPPVNDLVADINVPATILYRAILICANYLMIYWFFKKKLIQAKHSLWQLWKRKTVNTPQVFPR